MIDKVDKDVVQEKFRQLNIYLKELENFKNISSGELSASLSKQWMILHGLQISIQIIVDVGNHILAAIGESKIEGYVDIIDELGTMQIIPMEFSKKIRGIAGLRNILVHEYTQVDLKMVYNIIQHQPQDFYDFMTYINNYIEKLVNE